MYRFNKHMFVKKYAIIALLLCMIMPCGLYAEAPKTGCYWFWMNGNISKEGITKDLEYMHAAGIESATVFDAWIGVQQGPVDYGSPEWRACLKWACAEARRLGLKLMLHSAPGYSAVGGPWITPEESMKELTWSVSDKKTPPVPSHKQGFYRDIKTFRNNTADEMQPLDKHLEKGEATIVTLKNKKPFIGLNIWRGKRETPLDPFDGPRDYAPQLTIELSTDGRQWTEVGKATGPALKARDIPLHFHLNTAEGIEARYLRLTSNRSTNLARIEILTAEGSGISYRRVGYTTNGQECTAACQSGLGLEVDKLSRKGIMAHWNKFLKPLLDELRDYCGTTLTHMMLDSWEAGGQDWTESLGADYLTTDEGKDFVRGSIYRNNSTKARLWQQEFLETYKTLLEPYGLQLAGEPYGNGDFDRKEYGLALDLPMSEYWARSHYGSIDRPRFVTRYGRTAGRPFIGCECFTAYPGDADIPATLSSFRDDIDKLCDAGVNYFVLHCVAHQADDAQPLTMGPFGTRFDRAHANVDSVRAITDYIRQRIELQSHRAEFDFYTSLDAPYDAKNEALTEGMRAYIRLPRGQREVKAVLYCHQNMTEEVLFRNAQFTHKMDSLGIAMAFVQRGSQNWDVTVKDAQGRSCQERFEQLMKAFAEGTEHPEIASAKVIPFGHSAQATFPWNFAAWNPERTLCIISYHGDAPRTNLCGYGGANVEWGRTRNIDRIPALMVEGEYEWWEGRVNPALAFRMHYPDSRISFLCDAGRGHFDLCQQTMDYMALFIEKAMHYTPVSTQPTGGELNPFIPQAADGVYYSRWYEDGHETTDPHDQFWYFDDEMVRLTKARYDEHKGKRMQYVSARMNGQLLTYNKQSHVKINVKCAEDTFSLEPVFVNADRDALSDSHAQVRPRIVLISGPAIQTGEYTFKVDPLYFGKDPKRLWTGVTLSVEADGDADYKPVQQEINVQVDIK